MKKLRGSIGDGDGEGEQQRGLTGSILDYHCARSDAREETRNFNGTSRLDMNRNGSVMRQTSTYLPPAEPARDALFNSIKILIKFKYRSGPSYLIPRNWRLGYRRSCLLKHLTSRLICAPWTGPAVWNAWDKPQHAARMIFRSNEL